MTILTILLLVISCFIAVIGISVSCWTILNTRRFYMGNINWDNIHGVIVHKTRACPAYLPNDRVHSPYGEVVTCKLCKKED